MYMPQQCIFVQIPSMYVVTSLGLKNHPDPLCTYNAPKTIIKSLAIQYPYFHVVEIPFLHLLLLHASTVYSYKVKTKNKNY